MASPIVGVSSSTSNFDKTTQAKIRKLLYDELRGGLPHLPTGAVIPATFSGKVASGNNGTFVFNRVEDLDADPASHYLDEGVPPAGQTLEIGTESFTAKQSGDFIRLTDKARLMSIHDLASVAAERIVTQQKTIIDRTARELWANGSNVLAAGTGSVDYNDVGSGDIMTGALIRQAVAILEGAGVPKINGKYIGFMHPFVKFDFLGDEDAGGWIETAKYAASQQLLNNEIGTYAGVRWLSDKDVYVMGGAGESSNDVYVSTIIGANSIAFGDVSTCEVLTSKGPDTNDPLAQLSTVGWKMWIAGCLVGEGDNGSNPPEPRYINLLTAATLGA